MHLVIPRIDSFQPDGSNVFHFRGEDIAWIRPLIFGARV